VNSFESDLNTLLFRMLTEISGRAPYVPGYFENAMDVCRHSQLPDVKEWFLEQIKAIAKNDQADSRWSDLLKQRILLAATTQVPGTTAAARPIWLILLSLPQYANLALTTLGQTPQERIDLLEAWWNSGSPDRNQDLPKFLLLGVNLQDTEPLIAHLGHRGARWPMELKEEVNKVLKSQGVRLAFRPAPVKT
jgi:hypothetical protein